MIKRGFSFLLVVLLSCSIFVNALPAFAKSYFEAHSTASSTDASFQRIPDIYNECDSSGNNTPSSTKEYTVVMTAEKFVACLITALNRKTKYDNHYPQNCGYYNGDSISWDCWDLGYSIIWSDGEIVNNYTVGTWQKPNGRGGLASQVGWSAMQKAEHISTDFSNLVPGEWLYLDGHMGFYIGDGHVIECTPAWGANGVTQSDVDSNGNRTRNGYKVYRWQYHAMVPWIDYSGVICNHHYNPQETGECTICHKVFDWEATCDTTCATTGKVSKSGGFYPRNSKPYDVDDHAAQKLKKNSPVSIICSYTNAYGNLWYKISYNNGSNIGYAYSEWLQLDPKPSRMTINVTWPTENQTIPRAMHRIGGTVVSSSYPIKKIEGFFDNHTTPDAVISVNTMSFNLSTPAFDNTLYFERLSPGLHTIRIVATDSSGATQEFVRTFYTEMSPCEEATVTTEDVWGGKFVEISCPGANISYTTNFGDSGNGVGTVRAYIEDTTTFTIKTSKVGKSDRIVSRTISVEQAQAPVFDIVESYSGTRITLTSNSDATIYYYYEDTSDAQYTGPFNVTRNVTVFAFAIASGMRMSETTSYTVQSILPVTPSVQRLDTQSMMATGKTASFTWNSDPKAQFFVVSTYKDGALVETETVYSNVYSFVLETAGFYEVTVHAVSPLGDTEESERISVTAVDPSKVRFLDSDGTVLAEYTVSYGDYVDIQTNPSHKGHYFTGWYPSNNYYEIPVTGDVSYTATYSPIEYNVIFYDADGVKIGETQRVPYQQSAVPPDYSASVPTGYVFAGWTVIEASEEESCCDYTCVDANLKLQAVICWENEELPLSLSVSSATVAPEGNDSVYTVVVDAVNWPTSSSNVYLVAALKTQDGNTGVYKTVHAERVSVNFSAGQTKSVSISLHYNGIARKVEVFALERKSGDITGSAYSTSVSSNIVFSTTWTDWSEWSISAPDEIEGRTIETVTQYRYQTKEFATGSSDSMSGWILYDSELIWGPWGDWSGWNPTVQTGSDSVEVESRTEWRYYYFYCPYCGGHEPFQGKSDCGHYTLTASNAVIGWFPISYANSNWRSYSYTNAKRYTESLGDGQRWNFSAGNLYDTAPGTLDASGPSAVVIRTAYRYRTRSQVPVYYFFQWTDWSDWGETPVTATGTCNVETRTLYRYRDEVAIYDPDAGTEDTAGNSYRFTGTIISDLDLSGKAATIMVYQSRNMDPNQYQMQFVGQITIQTGNSYDFSFIPKTEPTAESGNYVVSLGIQGTTGLLTVGVVYAPRAEYTVRFLMDDGSLLSSQTVFEGDNAVVPDIPTKPGYRFIGWSERTTDIYKSVDIIAQFEKERYMVAFVDWVNQAIGFGMYYYGDIIAAPYTPEAEGRVFVGWDAIIDGNAIVTDNMIVAAVYDAVVCTVRFMDASGNVFDQQEITYGAAATLPGAVEAEGKVFLGWSTDVAWWKVTSDIDVLPILVYEETTIAPIANGNTIEKRVFISGMQFDLELFSEDGSTIYYTTDGTSPTADSNVYSEPIHLEETTIVNAIAVANGKNTSEIVEVYFVYDDTPQAEWNGNLIPLDCKAVEVEAEAEVPIVVEINNSSDLIGYSFVLECDRSVFYINPDDEVTVCIPGEISCNGAFYVSPYEDAGWKITWISAEPLNSDGVLFTLPLKVSDEAESGTYEIRLDYIEGEIYSPESDEITLTAETVHISDISITRIRTVTFVDWDGTILSEQYVEYGCAAVAPENPSRYGYIFVGWDTDFSNVTSDLTVNALYEAIPIYQLLPVHSGIIQNYPQLTYSAYLEYRNKTATTAEVRVIWTTTIHNSYDSYGQRLVVSTNTGSTMVMIVPLGAWGSPSNNPRSSTRATEWMPVRFADSSSFAFSISIHYYQINSNGADMSGSGAGFVSETWNFSIPSPHTVTFKDWDDTVLKIETVEHGSSATAPDDPSREGYTFVGWDVDFSNVTADLIVTAQYEAIPEDAVMFTVASVRALPGKTAIVPVSMDGEFSMNGVVLTVTYDPDVLTLNEAAQGAVWNRFVSLGGSVIANDQTAGTFRFAAILPQYASTLCGELFSLSFTVSADAEMYFTTPVTLTVEEFYSYGGGYQQVNIPYAVTNGEVEINGVMGDVDGNGSISSFDALLILRHVLGLLQLTPEKLSLADVDGNGQVSSFDALLVLRMTLGLIQA